MKTQNLLRIGMLPLLALVIFACQKDLKAPSLTSDAKSDKITNRGGPDANWTVSIETTKDECDEQVFFVASFNQNGGETDGLIEFKIDDIVVASGTGSITVTTHLLPGDHELYASVSTGVNFRGESAPQTITVLACGCTYKELDELTCEDMPESMEIGEVDYNHAQLCELLAYNRGNHGYGALVRLAQAVMVAKWNGFTSDHEAVAAAEALIGSLNALDAEDQVSVVDQYGATEKGHVQDLVKCPE